MIDGSNSQAYSCFRSLRLDRRLLLWGYAFAFSFDFKKIDAIGETSFQVLMVVLAFTFGGLYWLIEEFSPRISPARLTVKRVALIWWAYLGTTLLPVLIWNINFENYLKVILPFILFGISLLVMSSLERRDGDPMILLHMIIWGALVSTIWRALYAVKVGGLDLEVIRWQILSPGIPLLLGFGVAGIFLKQNSRLSVIALITSISVVILSITRSYIIIAIFLLAGTFIIDMYRHSRVDAVRRGIKTMAIFGLSLVVGAAAISFLRPDFIAVWEDRLMQDRTATTGMDFTLITRLAEYKGQWVDLTKDWSTILLGNGIGSIYTWNYDILAQLPFNVEITSHSFAGHSTWVFPFYSSGIILGFVIPAILLGAMIHGFRASIQQSNTQVYRGAVTGTFMLLAYLGQSLTANIFNERYAGLMLGIIAGSLYIYRKKIKFGTASYKCRIETR